MERHVSNFLQETLCSGFGVFPGFFSGFFVVFWLFMSGSSVLQLYTGRVSGGFCQSWSEALQAEADSAADRLGREGAGKDGRPP